MSIPCLIFTSKKDTHMKSIREYTDSQVLAQTIGVSEDKGAEILYKQGLSLAKMASMTVKDWQALGLTKTASIKAVSAFELSRRRYSEMDGSKAIRSSEDLHQYIHAELGDLQHEEFYLVYLNRANKLIGKERLSVGGMHGTVVDVKVLAKKVLHSGCATIALAHNHPSGNHTPSQEDRNLTSKVKQAMALLDITVIDHIIVCNGGIYTSFADEGIL